MRRDKTKIIYSLDIFKIISKAFIKKAREFQKNIYFCFIDYAKAFDYVDHIKLCKILQEMGIPRAVLRRWRNRMGRPLSPPQINKINHLNAEQLP